MAVLKNKKSVSNVPVVTAETGTTVVDATSMVADASNVSNVSKATVAITNTETKTRKKRVVVQVEKFLETYIDLASKGKSFEDLGKEVGMAWQSAYQKFQELNKKPEIAALGLPKMRMSSESKTRVNMQDLVAKLQAKLNGSRTENLNA